MTAYKNALASALFFLSLIFIGGCSTLPIKPLEIECAAPRVPVTGYARAFVGGARLSGADIRWLERNKHFNTNAQGQFAFCAKPGEPVTLAFHKVDTPYYNRYADLQSATIFVPRQGLVGKYNELTFQAPREITYRWLKRIVLSERHAELRDTDCHVVATVSGYHKTMDDEMHGEEGAVVELTLQGKRVIPAEKPFYFGVLLTKTNPFTPGLNHTSRDGGVLFINLPASKSLYTLKAYKKGVKFTDAYFKCLPNRFINLSPPQGPRVVGPLNN